MRASRPAAAPGRIEFPAAVPAAADYDGPSIDAASCCARINWTWVERLINVGAKMTLADFDPLPVDDQADTHDERLSRAWAEEQAAHPDDPHVLRAMWAVFAWPYVFAGLIQLPYIACSITQPMMLGLLVTFIGDASQPAGNGWTYALVMIAAAFGQMICHHSYYFEGYRSGVRWRTALSLLIYRKALRLSSASLGQTTLGQVVNLISNDADKVLFTFFSCLRSRSPSVFLRSCFFKMLLFVCGRSIC